jgi:xanthine dehydrogenase accessory factor
MHSEISAALKGCLEAKELVALATVVAGQGIGRQLLVWPGGQTFGDLGAPRLNQRAALHAEQLLPSLMSGRKTFRHQGQTVDVFVDVYSPPAKLVVVGAVHVAVPLVTFAKELGFETIVVDPRAAFASRDRFRHADRVVCEWPQDVMAEVGLDEASYVAVLSHDNKIDLPALESALRSRARYIGVLGSKKTHAKRVAGLLERGLTEAEIARVHSPIGLDLGGRQAEEIAVAIVGEMIAVHHGRAGKPPGDTTP